MECDSTHREAAAVWSIVLVGSDEEATEWLTVLAGSAEEAMEVANDNAAGESAIVMVPAT